MPAVVSSSLVSAPSNAEEMSVEMAGPPVTSARRPWGRPVAVTPRIALTVSVTSVSVSEDGSGTGTSAARPSCAGTGGGTVPPTARGASSARSAAIAARSAAVRSAPSRL